MRRPSRHGVSGRSARESMANIKSQIKRIGQSEARRERNKSVRSELKTRTKSALFAAEDGADDVAAKVAGAGAAHRQGSRPGGHPPQSGGPPQVAPDAGRRPHGRARRELSRPPQLRGGDGPVRWRPAVERREHRRRVPLEPERPDTDPGEVELGREGALQRDAHRVVEPGLVPGRADPESCPRRLRRRGPTSGGPAGRGDRRVRLDRR